MFLANRVNSPFSICFCVEDSFIDLPSTPSSVRSFLSSFDIRSFCASRPVGLSLATFLAFLASFVCALVSASCCSVISACFCFSSVICSCMFASLFASVFICFCRFFLSSMSELSTLSIALYLIVPNDGWSSIVSLPKSSPCSNKSTTFFIEAAVVTKSEFFLFIALA